MADPARPTETDSPAEGAAAPMPAIAHRAPPANRYVLPRRTLRFLPRLRSDDDHPRGWTFPAYLDNPGSPWLATLKEMYASPVTFPASLSPEAGLMLFSLVRNIRPRLVVEVGTFLGISTLWMAAALEDAAGDPPTIQGARRQQSTGGDSEASASDSQASASDSLRAVIHCFDDFGPMPPGPWRDASINEERDTLVGETLRRAGLSHRAVLHKGDSSATILAAHEMLRAAGGGCGVDFALIDGDHSEAGALKDLCAIEPILNTGGYILLHDTFPEQCGDHQGPRHIIDHVGKVAQGLYECCELYTAPLNYGMALLRRIG